MTNYIYVHIIYGYNCYVSIVLQVVHSVPVMSDPGRGQAVKLLVFGFNQTSGQ